MRRVREWPRLIAAVALLAAVLVLIGVVVASAASSGGGGNTTTKPAASTPLLKAPKSDQAAPANDAALRSQAAEITRLRASNASQKAQIATLEQQLKRERALARMRIHAKVKHHAKHHANRR
jgi:negative regulator of sigma E activity